MINTFMLMLMIFFFSELLSNAKTVKQENIKWKKKKKKAWLSSYRV